MIHILALAGFAVMVLLPVSMGVAVTAKIRFRDRILAFLGAPFGLIAGIILVFLGWGDWPDMPAGGDVVIWKCVFALGAVGIILGILSRFKPPGGPQT